MKEKKETKEKKPMSEKQRLAQIHNAKIKSPARARASRENGKLGGRPKKVDK